MIAMTDPARHASDLDDDGAGLLELSGAFDPELAC